MPSSRLEQLRNLDRQGRLHTFDESGKPTPQAGSSSWEPASPPDHHTSTRTRHNYGYDILDGSPESEPKPSRGAGTTSRLEKLRRLDAAGKLYEAAGGGHIDTPPAAARTQSRMADTPDSDSPVKPLGRSLAVKGAATPKSWLQQSNSTPDGRASPLIMRNPPPREIRPPTLVQQTLDAHAAEEERLRASLQPGPNERLLPRPSSRPPMVQQIFDRLDNSGSPSHSRSPSPPEMFRQPAAHPAAHRSRSPSPQAAEAFDKLDTNADGVISRKEWDDSYEPQRVFDRLDTNHDGVLEKGEWLNAVAVPEQGLRQTAHSTQGLRQMPAPLNVHAPTLKHHNAALKHQKELLEAPSVNSTNQKLDEISGRMRAIEARLRQRQERAAQEQQKVSQVQQDLAQLEEAQIQGGAKTAQFKKRTSALERDCGQLEAEFTQIMARATQLRSAMHGGP